MSADKEYSNYISLGYFCSVAMELERIGLRSASFPFDWLITPQMINVMQMIETHFDGFLDEEELIADRENPSLYQHRELGFSYVHDFKAEPGLHEQLPAVTEKYSRRIERFYDSIKKPTLFVRYISDETGFCDGASDDLRWIEDNHEHILQVLKAYNPENDIIWIANSTLRSDKLSIYYADKDENDTVARRPLDKNPELKALLADAVYEGREENLKIYRRKERKKNSIAAKVKRRLFK